MTMPVRARWRAVPRAVRWPVLAVVALYAAYLLLGNLFLNTPLGTAALNRTPDRFVMQWGAGMTWWPGRLTLWDVSLHGRTTRSRWEASADRLHGQVRLLPLLHRQLLVPELHAQGVRGGLHASDLPGAAVASPSPASSLANATASSATVTATTTTGASAPRTSQVDGMPVNPAATNAANASTAAAGEALTAATAATAPNASTAAAATATTQQAARSTRSQTTSPAWTLQFDRIVAEQVQALTLRQLQIAGDGQLQFGLFKQLRGGSIEVFPSRAVFEHATLHWAGTELLRNGQLRVEASIARHTAAQARGLAVLQLTDALIGVRGDTAALEVTRDAQGKTRLKTRAGQGRADGELRWARGELQPGSHLQWRTPLHDGTRTPNALLGELAAQLQVDQDMRLRVSMPEPADAGLTLDADLRVQGRRLPLQAPRNLLPRTSGHARMHWQLASLSWIPALFPGVDWLTLEGDGLVDADLRIVRGQLAASDDCRCRALPRAWA